MVISFSLVIFIKLFLSHGCNMTLFSHIYSKPWNDDKVHIPYICMQSQCWNGYDTVGTTIIHKFISDYFPQYNKHKWKWNNYSPLDPKSITIKWTKMIILYSGINVESIQYRDLIVKQFIIIIFCGVCKIKDIYSVMRYTIYGAVCFQFTHFPCNDWENIHFALLSSSNWKYELISIV